MYLVLHIVEVDKQYLLVCFCLSRFCGGLILDIKRKAPFFISDFTDAFHIQSLSTIMFIYLGTVTNAITFGGLLGDATENMQVSHFNSNVQTPHTVHTHM